MDMNREASVSEIIQTCTDASLKAALWIYNERLLYRK
jgi:hypothetical protein